MSGLRTNTTYQPVNHLVTMKTLDADLGVTGVPVIYYVPLIQTKLTEQEYHKTKSWKMIGDSGNECIKFIFRV